MKPDIKTKHTPGPWRVHKDAISVGQSPRGALICRATEVFMARKEREANARLIAAAPDLLAVLDSAPIIADYIDCEFGVFNGEKFFDAYHIWQERKRAAIAKALGSDS